MLTFLIIIKVQYDSRGISRPEEADAARRDDQKQGKIYFLSQNPSQLSPNKFVFMLQNESLSGHVQHKSNLIKAKA